MNGPAYVDPIAPMRFLRLYDKGLARCTHCGGPMRHPTMFEGGHYSCFNVATARALREIAPTVDQAADTFAALAKATGLQVMKRA